MRDGEAERITDPARSGPTRRVPFGRVVHSFLELLYDSVHDEYRPSPRRPLVSWIDDGGNMPRTVILQSTHEAALDVLDLAGLKHRALELT
jgi:hypothetical protein